MNYTNYKNYSFFQGSSFLHGLKYLYFCRLPYPTYFGGLTVFSREQVVKSNGLSNRFFGWGGEDDDYFNRYSTHHAHSSEIDFQRHVSAI